MPDNHMEYYCEDCKESFWTSRNPKHFAVACPFCMGKRGLKLIVPVHNQTDLQELTQNER